MAEQIVDQLDRLDAALTHLEDSPHIVESQSLVETESMVASLRQDSLALVGQFHAHRETSTQMAGRLDALTVRVRGLLGE